MHKLILKISLLTLLGSLFLGALPVHAETNQINLGDTLDSGDIFNVGEILSVNNNNETPETNEQGQTYMESDSPVAAFILDIINFITKIIGTIAMLLIIIGGLMMIASQGEEHLLQKGKDTLITAIFGLGIAMFAYIIVRFVQSLFYLTGS